MFLNSEQEKDKTHFMDQESGVELELEENMPLLEWLANNYKRFGAALEIITGTDLEKDIDDVQCNDELCFRS